MQEKTYYILTALDECKIEDKFLRAAILANIEKECGNLTPKEENIKAYSRTSNDRIRKIFGSRVRDLSEEELNSRKRNPYEFAELIYGRTTRIGRGMKNLDEGDGWKFRGRGFIQLTGKSNYEVYGKRIGTNLVKNPELLIDDIKISAMVSINFILHNLRGVNTFESQLQANRAVTQAIGGRRLNLDKGYGLSLLSKVNKLSKKYTMIV